MLWDEEKVTASRPAATGQFATMRLIASGGASASSTAAARPRAPSPAKPGNRPFTSKDFPSLGKPSATKTRGGRGASVAANRTNLYAVDDALGRENQ